MHNFSHTRKRATNNVKIFLNNSFYSITFSKLVQHKNTKLKAQSATKPRQALKKPLNVVDSGWEELHPREYILCLCQLKKLRLLLRAGRKARFKYLTAKFSLLPGNAVSLCRAKAEIWQKYKYSGLISAVLATIQTVIWGCKIYINQ